MPRSVAAGAMPFAHALEAAAARGAEMTRVSMADNGWMAAVIGPYETVEKTLRDIDGYVVAANLNSHNQTVIGGASAAVQVAIDRFNAMGLKAIRIPVSHAFHTDIVAPASKPLRQLLNRLSVSPPRVPVIANVTGEPYPADVEAIKDLLERQIASPVQWARSLETCYNLGVRAFLEVGPKKVLKGFVDNVVGGRPGTVSLFTNHPDFGEIAMFNQALCGLYAAGYGAQDKGRRTDDRRAHLPLEIRPLPTATPAAGGNHRNGIQLPPAADSPLHATDHTPRNGHSEDAMSSAQPNEPLAALAQLLAQALTSASRSAPSPDSQMPAPRPFDRNDVPLGSVVISGAGLGLPGTHKQLMDPENAARILRGEQFIDLVPEHYRKLMLNKQITRVVKAADGSGSFETLTDVSEVIKLAGQPGAFDLAEEYGVPAKLIEALDLATQIAMAAGLDALREAGIPLVQTFKRTSKGTHLPDRWVLPEPLRDETGVIFASAFPGYDRFAGELQRYYAWENHRAQLAMLEDLAQYTADPATLAEIHRRIAALREELDREPFLFDRRFILRILAMGHSQFAEYIGARGPNTQVNAACASTAHAISLAEDWIRSGRCRRVLVVSGDNVTSPHLMDWMGASFLALGATATDERVEDAALPFDRRRHGMILGIGAAALVIESEDAVRERGMRGIVEVLATETANSAYHATRLDADHISQVMERLLTAAERRFGINRFAIAPQTVFMSHETYTPARGGSASAEVRALRATFGPAANDIVVSNTKGFTGHTMGAGVEDVAAVKILEHGVVPPVPNFREVDPDLGVLNLSRGGRYPVQYGLRLAAGFGSQIAMTLTRRIPGGLDRVDHKPRYQRWLADVTGHDRIETEVVKRVLRVQAGAMPARAAAPSVWQHGTGPTVRAAAPGDISAAAYRPAPMAAIAQALGNGHEPVVKGQAEAAHSEVTHSRNGGAVKAAQATQHAVPVASALPSAPAPIVPAEAPSSAVAPKPAPTPAATTPPPVPVVVTPDPAPGAATDSVTAKVLEIVAAKTGYPQDMLDLDLDLEADLGIDTVKQAETLAAIRETFGIPVQQNLSLRDYPTLKHVIGFVYTMRPELQAGEPGSGGAAAQEPLRGSSEDKAEESRGAEQPDASDGVTAKVLEIVAAKTGYPQDMLDLDLDLEADLGIDTVKQAETLAAIRETFGIPVQQNLSLRDYPTLKHVIGFVYTMRPELQAEEPDSGGAAVQEQEGVVPASAPAQRVVQQPASLTLAAANRIPRRVPVPTLRPGIDLCKDTGVTLGVGSRVIVMQDEGGVGRTLVSRLQKLGATALVLEPGIAAADLETQVEAWLAEGGVQGVYWLPALDVEPDLEQLDPAGWHEVNRRRIKNLYATMRSLYASVAGPGKFLVTGTRLGGLHGYGEPAATAPAGGAVVGFAKAYAMEQGLRAAGRGLLVKAVDFEPGRRTAEPAEQLIAETLYDPGVIEVGYRGGLRFSVMLAEQPLAVDAEPSLRLGPDSVFVVTGAAGGITSAIVADLAAASRGVFYLLDLAQLPARDDPHVALLPAGTRGAEGRVDRGSARFRYAAHPSPDRPAACRGRTDGGGVTVRGSRGGCGRHRALPQPRSAGWRCSRVSDRRYPPALRTYRRIDPRGRAAGGPDAARQGTGAVRPGLRREGRRLLSSAACGPRAADRRNRGLQLGGRPFWQQRPERLQRGQRLAVQTHQQLTTLAG